MEKNIILLTLVVAVVFFIVGNPFTYAYVSKFTGLKVKNKKQHLLLVAIHSVVMSVVMFGVLSNLVIDKDCPPPKPKKCPPPIPPKKCPICEANKKVNGNGANGEGECACEGKGECACEGNGECACEGKGECACEGKGGANGAANGVANGGANGGANGVANGNANGAANGAGNGIANGNSGLSVEGFSF